VSIATGGNIALKNKLFVNDKGICCVFLSFGYAVKQIVK
jgi:hypothetical protein